MRSHTLSDESGINVPRALRLRIINPAPINKTTANAISNRDHDALRPPATAARAAPTFLGVSDRRPSNS